MNIFSYGMLASVLLVAGVNGMRPADQQLPLSLNSQALAKKQNLIIKNNYVDKLVVRYMRDFGPAMSRVIEPNKETSLEDVRKIIDIRFEAYGYWKQYLNFYRSENYRALLNDILDYDGEHDVFISVASYVQKASAPLDNQPSFSSFVIPEEKEGWALALDYGKKMCSGAAYYATYVGKEVAARIGSFQVTTGIEQIDLHYAKPEKYENRALFKAFPSAQKRIKLGLDVTGRHILGVTPDANVKSLMEAKQLLCSKWQQEIISGKDEGDVKKVWYAQEVLLFINEAYEDVNKIFSHERLRRSC